MNSRLPRITAIQVMRALEKNGFILVRQSSIHKIYKDATNKRVTVPFHAGKILHPKVLKSILVDAGLTIEACRRVNKGF